MTISLTMRSSSAATDAAWLAAADVAGVAKELDVPYRLIGGIAVTLLVHTHGASALAPTRETADADMGVSLDVVGDSRLVVALTQRGYTQAASNRFIRLSEDRDLVIDVLAPSYVGALVSNQQHGALVVDEVPGLLLALRLDPVHVALTATLSDGAELTTTLLLLTSERCSRSRRSRTAVGWAAPTRSMCGGSWRQPTPPA